MIKETGTGRYLSVASFRGLSTDIKPTNVDNGAEFLEIDTGDIYLFNEANHTWVKCAMYKPTDAQAEEYIGAWLDDHPEATTTVQDGAVTTAKLADGAVTDAKLAQSGGVLDDVSNLKSGLSAVQEAYLNETTQTVAAAGTFTNFSYKITAGHTYLCTALTVGNTMSFRTRLTEDGANIDSLNAVAYGAPKTFTATANANYIRVQSYLANGVFKIEDTGSMSYRIDELQPKVPIVNLPNKLYAVSGKELNIYFDNIVENSEKYTYDVVCSKGNQMQRGFSIIPEDTDAGSYDFALNVLNDAQEIIATASATLVIKTASTGSGATKTFILLGDSTVNGTDTQIVNNFSDDVMSVTSLGTRGTNPANHEGRTGWTFQYYYNSAEIGGIVNPFYNPTSHLFDADYYFNNSEIAKPDWFFIQLGINDVFLVTNETDLGGKINSMVTQCDYIINSVKTASPTTKIGIAVTIPPNMSQDAFGKAYGCGQTRARYKRNNMMWVNRLLSKYTDKEAENIYLIPICTNLDTIYNMGLESMPVNARNTENTYLSPVANGGVHPVVAGYMQLADVYTAFLKANA